MPPPPNAAPPPAPPRRRKRWPVGVAVGLLAVTAGGAVVLTRPAAKPGGGYTLDLTGVKPFAGQLRGGDPFPTGKLPAGWAGHVAKAGAVGELALTTDDPPELVVGLVGGEGPARLLFDPHKAAPGLRLSGGWVVRLEYRADAGTAAKLKVVAGGRVVAGRDLPPAEQWAKASLPFRSAGGQPRVAVEATAGGDGNRVRVRAVELAAE